MLKSNGLIIKKSAALIFIVVISLISIRSAFSQEKKSVSVKDDYKITASNENFIEIEFYPDYTSETDFNNSVSSVTQKGYPDIKTRTFPIFLPSNKNNRVEIIDAKYEEVFGVEIQPVPVLKLVKDKKIPSPVYEKDLKAYGKNFYYPGSEADLIESGILRNKYIGHLNINPVHYNPAAGTARKYSYIKVRVKFGQRPVFLQKELSLQEKSFLKDITINSDVAVKWTTEEFPSSGDVITENSIFTSGDFFKMEIKESGMYKLDKNYLQSKSINLSSIDPRTIKIFGNGGAELPYNNVVNYPFDPQEIRIIVIGEEDGVFNDDDYILFYARGPNSWDYDSIYRTVFHNINNFSNSNYYFFTYGNSPGQRMEIINSPNVSGLSPVGSFKERIFEEPEVNNLGSTGYLWVSQRIGINDGFTFNKELKDYVSGSNVSFRFRFGNGSFFNTNWRIEDLNSNFIVTQQIPPLSGYSHINLSELNFNRLGVSYSLSPDKSSVNIKASLPSNLGNSSNVSGYYDYYEIIYDRLTRADNNILKLNSPDTSGLLEFRISNFTSSTVRLFKVTDHQNVSLINPVSYNSGTLTFQSNSVFGNPDEFYAIGDNNYKTPVSFSARIQNQNLKGGFGDGADFIIISPKAFLTAANRLKAIREKPGVNYLKTIVVDIDQIYNEFASGIPDPVSMRNFLKYTFNNWQQRPVYVFLFGDGSYDYKNIYNLYNNGVKNWIPPIEKDSPYSDDVDSYCSDDYIMEINEEYTQPSGNAVPDFSAGRICSNSEEEANIFVDKILAYEDPANFDKWKNTNLYVGDDGWTTEQPQGQEGSLHTDQCEDVAQNHSPSFIKKDKIYIVSYPTVITPQGRRKPGANDDVIKGWNTGKLVINYTGHGSIDLWAHEHIFVRQVSIPLLSNKNKYPFVTIASCDLARWDDPFLISAGEQLVTLKDKGAIGVSAAVRPVYSVPNAVYNNLFYDNLFKKDTLNLTLRLGKALFNTKQVLHTDNDLKFTLISDPTMRLAVPQYFTRIDSINNTPSASLFNMKALQKIKLSGTVLKTDSSFWSDFNGLIDVTVLDVDKNISLYDFGYLFSYKQDGGIIFSGKANVINGNWNIYFVVPRDISYSTGRGKIIAYYKNDLYDGLGYSNNFIMSGLDSTAAADSTGPVISAFLDNRNFRSGDLTNQNPKIIADFFDENGLNLTGTIGHKLEAVINDDEQNKIDLTPFYSSSSGYQNGTVEYQLNNLPDGKYKLNIKAWDTYNNFGSSEIYFNVKSSEDIALENVYNYPNPMKDNTSFIFQHNSDEILTADIKIYTVSGRLIRELNKTNITDKFVNIEWDGRDDDGDAIANGTYIYKILIKSETGSFSKSSTGKLAKLK